MPQRRAETARGTRPRPRRAFGPVVGSLFGLGAWAAVAHNSGSGWVQALGALLAGFLVVGLVAPVFAVMRARITVQANQADAVAGIATTMELSATRTVAVTPQRLGGPTAFVHPGRHETVSMVPDCRGELTSVQLLLASAAPFGLLWWTKTVTVSLARTLVVSPRLGAPDPGLRRAAERAGEENRRTDARVGEPRGVRTYQTGDLRRSVHWPATAHTGKLMVREMEAPVANPVVVHVALPVDIDQADRLAERYLGTVAELLSEGRNVVLVTDEVGTVHEAPVATTADTGRRLARTVPLRNPARTQ